MKIYIYGAGSIGCYLGGRLVAAGNDVTFITRPRIHAELSQFGLVLTDYLGKKIKLAPHQLKLTTDPAQVVDADVIFICVKSAATEQVAQGQGLFIKVFEQHQDQHSLDIHYAHMPSPSHEEKLSLMMGLVEQCEQLQYAYALYLPHTELAKGMDNPKITA
jgi:hypothetical protein